MKTNATQAYTQVAKFEKRYKFMYVVSLYQSVIL